MSSQKNSPKGKTLQVYSNLSARRRQRSDAKARRKAEYLATLPKHPIKRLLYRLHPKRAWKFWTSRDGAIMALKIVGIGALLVGIMFAGLFAYFRKDLDAIRPGELSKRVQTTVTRYIDRNGELLWEDKGGGDYKIVVDFNEISKPMKQATVALEDKDFYKHGGVSFSGTARAVLNNAVGGGGTQGGSTLTQQLVKKVFFSEEEANQRSGLSGLSRKAKEAILAIEIERMYNKDQILNLYLNEVPYGGPRNGVESAAQTYFGKHAKELTLAEAAIMASIPQQPSLYNPYNVEGNEYLLKRQQFTLDKMLEQGYAKKEEIEAAKKEFPDSATLQSKLQPENKEFATAFAPHFVLEVKRQLKAEFGDALVGKGGLTVKTTLDKKAQEFAETAVNTGAKLLPTAGADNIALSSVDVETGQVIAMVGSADFNNEGINGQFNSATSPLEPGSSMKLYDYAALFKERDGTNYGPGSVLRDENIDDLYCAGNTSGKCQLRNFTGRFYGNVTVRQAFGSSLNIPAVKAVIVASPESVVQTAKDMGNIHVCERNATPGLSLAIGGGCTSLQVEHTNAYATVARNGSYKPLAYVLEVKNAQGQTLKQWKNADGKQALDPQVAYMLADTLADADARSLVFGASGRSYGFNIPGVKTATKTGTTDNGLGKPKDSWMMSFSPKVATGVWSGNHDGSAIGNSASDVVRRVVNDYMQKVHTDVYEPQGRWKPGDWFARPNGIQDLVINGRKDIYPSWFKKANANSGFKMTFDKISRKKATDCTPARAKVEEFVEKIKDPVRNVERLSAPDGYDPNAEDDRHKCSDTKPFVNDIQASRVSAGRYQIKAVVAAGTNPLQNVEFSVNGQVIGSASASASGDYVLEYTATNNGSIDVTVTAIDAALYDGSLSKNINVTVSSAGGGSGHGNSNSNRSMSWRERFADVWDE
ncbi:transglycosylase domain-containing protein [Candidatus Saccharibacteria bacterium]|nr:transglycosylase domain-containing protein [Candidatus Saccharibacteria bacterium]